MPANAGFAALGADGLTQRDLTSLRPRMHFIRNLSDLPAALRGGVVVLGNFDGVHRGHQTVIGQGADFAESEKAPLLVLSFEPHPRQFFDGSKAPFRLTDLRNKAHHLEALGIDGLVVLDFDAALAGTTAEEFITRILVEGLGAKRVVVGYDFCFGKGRKGTPDLMRQIGNFAVTTVDAAATHDGVIYSSTRIRDYLRRGNPAQAAALLGRPFEIEGRVQSGQKLGRTIGFPTANIELGEILRPAIGIYAIRVGVTNDETGETEWRGGAGYYGARPTVNGEDELFEAFLFDFSGDLYGKFIRVALIEFVRPDKKFENIESMKAQIAHDCDTARRILNARAAGG